MSGRWHIWTSAAAIVLGVLALTETLMEGLRLDSVAVVAVLIAVWVVGIWLVRGIWPAVLLGVACMPAEIGIPLPFVWRVELLSWVMLTITALAVVRRMAGEDPVAGLFLNHKLMLALIVAVLLRVAVDMPGSGQMGGRGGLSIALSYVAGVLAFPLGLWVGRHHRISGREVRTTAFLAALAYVLHIVLGTLMVPMQPAPGMFHEAGFYLGYLFEAPAWLLLSCVLATVVGGGVNRPLRAMGFTVFSLMGMSVAFVSVHRAFPIYAMAISSLAAWTHHRIRYVFPLLAAVVAAIIVIAGLHSRGVFLPGYLKRPVSAFLGKAVDGSGGEYGWENVFRSRRLGEFRATVREHPLFGRGFSFSAVDMGRELSKEGHFALLQSYHNSFFTLISACGLPIGVAFWFTVLWLSVKAALWARSLEGGREKTLAVALVAFLAVSLLHASLQGGGLFLARCLLTLGMIYGVKAAMEAGSANVPAPAMEPRMSGVRRDTAGAEVSR